MSVQQKALLLQSKQGEFEVGSRDIPKPGPGELLVKVQSAALNPVDWKIQAFGLFFNEYPVVLGSDAAGEVEEVGEGVTGYKKGDRVIHHGEFDSNYSTFQQYTLVPAEVAAQLPDNISFDQGASVPLALSTAAVGLYNSRASGIGIGLEYAWETSGQGKYSGQAIFIVGGSSSVGQFAIQLAKLSGFSSIITTAAPKHVPLLTLLGATDVIDRHLPVADVVASVTKIAGGPVQVVFDSITSAESQKYIYDVVAPSGSIATVSPTKTVQQEGSSVFEANIWGSVQQATGRKMGVSLFRRLGALLSEGAIKPNKVEVLPDGLQGIPSGLARIKAGKVSGQKLVARPQETV
ncbi:hypothetical protein PLICRDRAFT_109504 [Plicaturopsis crispa FD-325 SS-3]|nr:hypothetical protein PLICRDRAFT_109504 [Plicaturopsis crispa FD-325 SS-3]